MTITHHLDDATLMSFVAGALPAALSAVAAAHADMCPRCRREVATMERLGGAVMADLAPVAIERAEPLQPMPTPPRVRELSRRPATGNGEIPGRLPNSSAAASMPLPGGGSDPAFGTTFCL